MLPACDSHFSHFVQDWEWALFQAHCQTQTPDPPKWAEFCSQNKSGPPPRKSLEWVPWTVKPLWDKIYFQAHWYTVHQSYWELCLRVWEKNLDLYILIHFILREESELRYACLRPLLKIPPPDWREGWSDFLTCDRVTPSLEPAEPSLPEDIPGAHKNTSEEQISFAFGMQQIISSVRYFQKISQGTLALQIFHTHHSTLHTLNTVLYFPHTQNVISGIRRNILQWTAFNHSLTSIPSPFRVWIWKSSFYLNWQINIILNLLFLQNTQSISQDNGYIFVETANNGTDNKRQNNVHFTYQLAANTSEKP